LACLPVFARLFRARQSVLASRLWIDVTIERAAVDHTQIKVPDLQAFAFEAINLDAGDASCADRISPFLCRGRGRSPVVITAGIYAGGGYSAEGISYGLVEHGGGVLAVTGGV
jgi:hypothetical protein